MGQSITILGRGLTSSTQVQFAAADDTGFAGVVTRTGTANAAGTALTIAVPPQARSGALHARRRRRLGAGCWWRRCSALRRRHRARRPHRPGGHRPGRRRAGDRHRRRRGRPLHRLGAATSILGEAQRAGRPDRAGGRLRRRDHRHHQGRLVAAAAGLATLPDQTFSADPGDTLAAAAALNLPQDTTTAIVSTIGDGAYGSLDVDLYKFSGSAGDLITLGSQDSSPYPYLRIFDAAGDQLAAGNWYTTPSIADFRLPAAGTYYLGVSSAYNQAYDPAAGGSGGSAYYTGQYRLTVTRSDGLRTSIASISAVAASGTPARAGVASADVGQVITLHGTGFLAADQVAFTEADDAGNLSQVAVAPASVSADGTAITVAVPQGPSPEPSAWRGRTAACSCRSSPRSRPRRRTEPARSSTAPTSTSPAPGSSRPEPSSPGAAPRRRAPRRTPTRWTCTARARSSTTTRASRRAPPTARSR